METPPCSSASPTRSSGTADAEVTVSPLVAPYHLPAPFARQCTALRAFDSVLLSDVRATSHISAVCYRTSTGPGPCGEVLAGICCRGQRQMRYRVWTGTRQLEWDEHTTGGTLAGLPRRQPGCCMPSTPTRWPDQRSGCWLDGDPQMLWGECVPLVVRIGGPLVVANLITRMVALFGSNFYSERAMRIMRRSPLPSQPATPGPSPPEFHTSLDHDGHTAAQRRTDGLTPKARPVASVTRGAAPRSSLKPGRAGRARSSRVHKSRTRSGTPPS